MSSFTLEFSDEEWEKFNEMSEEDKKRVLKDRDRKIKEIDKSIQVAKELSDIANNMDDDSLGHKAFIDQICNRTHRTLQQSIFRDIIFPILDCWAADYRSKNFDARNEETCKIANLIINTLGFEDYIWKGKLCLPLI